MNRVISGIGRGIEWKHFLDVMYGGAPLHWANIQKTDYCEWDDECLKYAVSQVSEGNYGDPDYETTWVNMRNVVWNTGPGLAERLRGVQAGTYWIIQNEE